MERISVSTKKKILIATVQDDKVIYLNFEWAKL
jgi:tRNA splicing endonuclease